MKKLLFCLAGVLFISVFTSCLTDKKEDNYNYEDDISPVLIEAISMVIDDAREKMKSDEYFQDNFYLVRFFEYEKDEYVTIGVLGNFPTLCTQFKDKSLNYDYDFNLMYFFIVHGKKVIIMDYPKNVENPFFKKEITRNKIIPIIEYLDREKPWISFKMFILKTFLVDNKDDNPKLVLNKDIILSPAYQSEIGLQNIEIIDEN